MPLLINSHPWAEKIPTPQGTQGLASRDSTPPFQGALVSSNGLVATLLIAGALIAVNQGLVGLEGVWP